MKISNFRLKEVIGKSASEWKFKATVDVTTGFFFKKTDTVELFRHYGGNWIYLETGKFTPNDDVEVLERSYTAKQGKDLQCCLDV